MRVARRPGELERRRRAVAIGTFDGVHIGHRSVVGAAVAAGLGVTPLPRSCANLPGVEIWENAPLPKLPSIFSGIFVREGADADDREQVADAIAATLHPGPSLGDGRARSGTSAAA